MGINYYIHTCVFMLFVALIFSMGKLMGSIVTKSAFK